MRINSWTDPRTGEVRRYVDGWHEAAGIELEHYGTGNIRAAYYRDEKISNSRASLLGAIRVWVDTEGAIQVAKVSPRLEDVGVTAERIAADLAQPVARLIEDDAK